MSYDDEDKTEKLFKYYIVKGLKIISIIYRDTKEFIYNFFHPMSRVERDTLEEAESINYSLELFYGDMKFIKLKDGSDMIFYEGNKARLMAIFKPDTINPDSSKLIERILEVFLYEFESTFSKDLKDYKGDTSIFNTADKMLFEYLNVDLTFPHTSKYRGFDPDDPLEKYIADTAEAFTKEIGYFYLDNLVYLTKQHVLDKAVEQGKDPKSVDFPPINDFYLAMFNLKKIGMFTKNRQFLRRIEFILQDSILKF